MTFYKLIVTRQGDTYRRLSCSKYLHTITDSLQMIDVSMRIV